MIICTKTVFGISDRKIFDENEDGKFHFEVPINGEQPITVEIDAGKNTAEAYHESEISDAVFKTLQNKIQYEEMEQALQKEILDLALERENALKKIFDLIKFFLNQRSINERTLSFKENCWSIDKKYWEKFPLLPRSITVNVEIAYSLERSTEGAIQDCLANNVEPFVALHHLDKAKNETIPRIKWLDATTAAEFAAKEFLIRLKPEIETLLLKMPSPPLPILYGPVLKSFTGERSPTLSSLEHGMNVRNILIHRPSGLNISLEQADRYVDHVQLAIYHLLTLLYPKNELIKFFYKRMQTNLRPLNKIKY